MNYNEAVTEAQIRLSVTDSDDEIIFLTAEQLRLLLPAELDEDEDEDEDESAHSNTCPFRETLAEDFAREFVALRSFASVHYPHEQSTEYIKTGDDDCSCMDYIHNSTSWSSIDDLLSALQNIINAI